MVTREGKSPVAGVYEKKLLEKRLGYKRREATIRIDVRREEHRTTQYI